MRPWHIQNFCIFRILAYSKADRYSEPWYTIKSGTFRTRNKFRIFGLFRTKDTLEKQLTAMINFESYFYFHNISFSYPLVHEINMILLMLVWYPLWKPLFHVKKYRDWGWGARDREFWYPPSKFYSHITYYFWPRKYYTRRDNNKVDSIETGSIVIAEFYFLIISI